MPRDLPRCPRCDAKIFRKSSDGKLKISTNILVFGPNGAEGVCKRCGADVPLDVQPGESLQKALDEPPARLIVRKGLDSPDSNP